MSLFDTEALQKWEPAAFLADLEAGLFTVEHFPEGDGHPQETVTFKAESEAQEVLLRLFVEGVGVSENRVRGALPGSFEKLLEIGLLTAKSDSLVSGLRLRPTLEGCFSDDFPSRLFQHSDDFVMGVAPTTRMVKLLIPPGHPKRILDLCCGSGWLALTCAAEKNSVTATDLNPRALELARFNARLNGVDLIDWREGPWFEPVKGETFDLIVSNPPFVITPGSQAIALDTPDNDTLLPTLLGSLPEYLNPEGFACFLLEWPFESVDSWEEKPLSCLPEFGAQTFLFEVQRREPVEYARHWISQDPRFQDPELRDREIDRWVRHFKDKGYEGVSSGFVVMRKCERGEEWTTAESREVPGFNKETSQEIGRIFEGTSWLKTRAGQVDELLDVPFGAPEGISQTTDAVLSEGKWIPASIKLISPGMIAYNGHVDQSLLAMIEAASSSKTIREIVPELAEQVDSSPEAIAPQVAGLVEQLVRLGLLTPPVE